MGKMKTLDYFFKRKVDDKETNHESEESKHHKASTSEPQPQKTENQQEIEPQPQGKENLQENEPQPQEKENPNELDLKNLERDPAKRKQMWDYPVNLREQVRRAYMNLGPFQIRLKEYQAKVSIDTVHWLTFQACALRGHDESPNSKNCGSFLQLLKLLASYNDEVANIILEKAPYNSKYTSGEIQKEILSIIAIKVRKHIRSEVGDSYFCVMVDESRDGSKKEQMAIVLRFVDAEGIIRERFLDLVHVRDTLSLTLKTNMWRQLLHYQFDVSKIRGQGYDGASNMRGEWNGLQALVLKDCPYAYYVHCFAHRLQLALVAASREIIPVHQFFTNLIFTINVVCASSKRHDDLQKAKATEIEQLLELGEIESGKGLNQVGTFRRAGDTRWGSHFRSRGDPDAAYCYLKSFEFVFILHLIKEVMGKTDILSQALQKKSQDILNAMELVSATKEGLNDFRNKGWDSLLAQVKFFSTLNKQLHELNSRFNDQAVELLSLSSTLVSKEINVDQICLLVEKYYPEDFTEQERIQLRYQLEIFNIDMTKNPRLSGVSTIADLCKRLVETQKRETYYLLDRVVRLILTLPVSTVTTERGFSAMKIFKNRLRNKMSDDFLANNLVIYIEREIVENIDLNSVIDEFTDIKGRRAEL
ncbi:uncharacterized protein LOC111901409 [Lactuca sativa]|uniref:uncharacterized protein LOC111901409 n=1 Tax=Lactuca sativa TaxID=4236 RepID=UPI000CD7F26A|nr:uncharacterized protein LOC111901409 [Lactuca sativa]